MGIVLLFVLGCLAGFLLFRRNGIASGGGRADCGRLSVIIPARNEEANLPHLLESLRTQTCPPHEVIVVDDSSSDRTREIAESYGVKVIPGSDLPPGWTGKNWAVWNGYAHASGDLIAFLDADIRLAPLALERLLAAREKAGGVISVVPFHHTEKWYERLAMITNILGVFAFTSPFENGNPKKGLYGSCIVTSRDDYERIGGHRTVRSEVLDDLNLGARYMAAGIPVTNFIGCGLVSFRMYPGGIRSEVEGFAKGAVLSTSTLRPGTIMPTAVWTLGLIVSEAAPFMWHTPWAVPMLIGYALYWLQILYFIRTVGRFGFVMPALHVLSGLFFLFVMAYSAYRVAIHGNVAWKGRHIKVGGSAEK